jgi:hypothetical protein
LNRTAGTGTKCIRPVDHNASDSGQASPIAGLYDVVNGVFYFTGYSATMKLCTIDRTTVFANLPDALEPTVIRLLAECPPKKVTLPTACLVRGSVRGCVTFRKLKAEQLFSRPSTNQLTPEQRYNG